MARGILKCGKRRGYSWPLIFTNSMPLLEVPGEMKKKPEQKNVSFHIATNLGNGTQKTNDLNCGICLMAKKITDKNLEQIKKLNKTYFDLKMKHASLALKETHKLSETRKDIARIKTQMNQEKRAIENE